MIGEGELVLTTPEAALEAQDYKKLVKALRCKRDDCEGCDLAFFDKDEGWMCRYSAKDDDAAAAIEALQAEVDAMKETLKAVQKNSGINFRMWEEAQAEVKRLKAQLPKQGEWKRDEKRWGDNLIRCSLCGAVIEDDEWGWRNYYCYHCGAKMKVWDGESNN